MSKPFQILIGCCAVFFWAALAYGQEWADTCAHLKVWVSVHPQTAEDAKLQYDSVRLYIEKCAATDDQSFGAFGHLDGAVQILSNDTTRFESYRTWLISVLYLNTTNSAYFCNCLGSIAGTFQYGKFKAVGFLAVLNYIRSSHRECWTSDTDAEYAQDSAYDVSIGYDPTHLPSLDSMGLVFLLHNAVVPNSGGKLTTDYLGSFTSSPNPFIKETTLEFTLNRMSYITIAVFDDLGRIVWGDGRGSLLEAGAHTIHLDGSSLPSGTLYARIATGFGEVKTVKLIHEK